MSVDLKLKGGRGEKVILLDGAMGTALEAAGVVLRPPAWSATAVLEHPDVVEALHRSYAEAGADVLTACTFRTTARALGDAWESAARRAVALARKAARDHPGVRVAGSIAPLEDCWHPERAPGDPFEEHRALAEVLAEAGADLLLCETFTSVEEGLAAARAASTTGLPVWLSFSAGPAGDLLTLEELGAGLARAKEAGATVALVNCVPLPFAERCVPLLAESGLAWGLYPNTGLEGGLGPRVSGAALAEAAAGWVAAGASVVGACCGSRPDHVRVLAARLGRAKTR